MPKSVELAGGITGDPGCLETAFRSVRVVCTSPDAGKRLRFRRSGQEVLGAVFALEALCYSKLGLGKVDFDPQMVVYSAWSIRRAMSVFSEALDEALVQYKRTRNDQRAIRLSREQADIFKRRIEVLEAAAGSLRHLEKRCEKILERMGYFNGDHEEDETDEMKLVA